MKLVDVYHFLKLF